MNEARGGTPKAHRPPPEQVRRNHRRRAETPNYPTAAWFTRPSNENRPH